MTPDDLALQIAQRCHGRYEHNDAALVIEALASLGYDFVPPGTAGRFHESDEVRHALVQYLEKQTGVHRQVVKDILVGIELFGLRVREPHQHPSGLKTHAYAFENVPRTSAARAAAQKPIDMRMPGQGRNYA